MWIYTKGGPVLNLAFCSRVYVQEMPDGTFDVLAVSSCEGGKWRKHRVVISSFDTNKDADNFVWRLFKQMPYINAN